MAIYSTMLRVDAEALQSDKLASVPLDEPSGRTLVGCGRAMSEQSVLIVDPQTYVRSNSGEIGEIWVAGPSVA